MKPLVLASSSPYRKALLARLGMPFTAVSPDVDESSLPHETPSSLVKRLAEAKAQALAPDWPDHWIVGSDQVACLPDGSILTKPGDHDTACRQLRRSSGRTVTFHTGLALLDSSSGRMDSLCENFQVVFRELDDQDIEHYLLTEQPLDCAGSFRMEGLGITLFERMEGRDPNSLIGLPLIALNSLLRAWGLDTLGEAYRNSRRD
ncbi:Maf family protein [Marinobacter sp.]|uniref:Maf family protein n=1 Tax=Marinobacter sp. TaxID=50741 RepID=UPI003850AF43